MMISGFDMHALVGDAVRKACSDLFSVELAEGQLQLQKTRKEFEGDITVVVFPLTKLSKLSPEATGEALGKFLTEQVVHVSKFNVVKGFLNLSMSAEFWKGFFAAALKQDDFGFAAPNSAPHVMVEYSSPNTNKPLHLGHLRNNFLGYSVSEILKAVGHRVTKVQIINDRGIHICKSMVAWVNYGNGETPESSGLKGDKLVGKYYVEFDKAHKAQMKELIEQGMAEEQAGQQTAIMQQAQNMLRLWEARDEETIALWTKMNGWVYKGFEETYAKLGVAFDKEMNAGKRAANMGKTLNKIMSSKNAVSAKISITPQGGLELIEKPFSSVNWRFQYHAATDMPDRNAPGFAMKF
jgi:arginyl-tRNA synthetase